MAVELSSFALRWTPWFLSSRKLANFFVVSYGGDPGGEGGIFRFGIGGMVSSRIAARDDEYVDDVTDVESSSTFSSEGRIGPTDGSAFDGPCTFDAWFVSGCFV